MQIARHRQNIGQQLAGAFRHEIVHTIVCLSQSVLMQVTNLPAIITVGFL